MIPEGSKRRYPFFRISRSAYRVSARDSVGKYSFGPLEGYLVLRKNFTKRNAVALCTLVVGTAVGLTAALGQDAPRDAKRDVASTRCLVCLQLNDLDPAVLADETAAKNFLDRCGPFIVQELVRAKAQPRSRGCSVSGTAFGGSGGFGGSGTVTCTF